MKTCNVCFEVSENFRARDSRCRPCSNRATTLRRVKTGESKEKSKLVYAKRKSRTDDEISSDRGRLRPNGIKTCSKCQETKSLSEYSTNRGNADGLNFKCRLCFSIEGKVRHSQDYVADWITRGIDVSSCVYCIVKPFEHIDHVIPLSRGGIDTPSNTLPSCSTCNIAKRNDDPIEWYAKYFGVSFDFAMEFFEKKNGSMIHSPLPSRSSR